MPLTRRDRRALRHLAEAITYVETGPIQTSTCTTCRQPIRLLGGTWTDGDGCTDCAWNLNAPYAPHEPEG